MSILTIDNETTVTNNPNTSLNVSVVSGQNIAVLTLTGPMGPQGPSGQNGGGGSLCPTGIFSDTNGGNPVLVAGTDAILQVWGNGTSGSAPVSQNIPISISQNIFGDPITFLGNPDGWLSTLISGRAARVPYYYV